MRSCFPSARLRRHNSANYNPTGHKVPEALANLKIGYYEYYPFSARTDETEGYFGHWAAFISTPTGSFLFNLRRLLLTCVSGSAHSLLHGGTLFVEPL